MNRVRRAWRGVTGMLFPWPRKDEREQAVAAARREREQAATRAGHAERIRRDIERLAAENHYAGTIAAQIIARHHKRGA